MLTLHFQVSLFGWFFSHKITVLDGFFLSPNGLSCSALQLRAVFSMQLLHSLYAVFSMQLKDPGGGGLIYETDGDARRLA